MTPPPPGGATIPPPPIPFTCNRHVLPAGTVIHRIHDRRFGAAEFNPGRGDSRFAPFEIGGASVPTAYAATSFECAAFETIFHDIDPAAAFKSVYWSALERLIHSRLTLARDLELAPLFSADLIRFGIERSHLIDTPRSAYPKTGNWSPAIHEAPTRPQGMIWVSRRYDEERAMMLFGSRVAAADLIPSGSVGVATDPKSLAALHEISKRTEIDIIR